MAMSKCYLIAHRLQLPLPATLIWGQARFVPPLPCRGKPELNSSIAQRICIFAASLLPLTMNSMASEKFPS
jgi:hypothetical protein